MTDINSTQAIILAVLSKRNASGSVVEEEARKLEGHWHVTRSQIYRELHALSEAGLLRRVAPGDEWRGKEPFEITDDGHAAFRSWFIGYTSHKLATVTRNPWILRQKLSDYTDIPTEDRDRLASAALYSAQDALNYESLKESPDPVLMRKLQADVDWFSKALS